MNIVVIDDDTALLKSLKIILSGQGHNVLAFDNPREAYTSLKEGGPVDVLIVDYMLPGVTGESLLELLRRYVLHLANSKVIMITGHLEMIDGVKLKRMGVAELLPKPLDLHELCKVVGSG
jgi:two-component system cell cycle response regulator CtrA